MGDAEKVNEDARKWPKTDILKSWSSWFVNKFFTKLFRTSTT